LVAKHPRAHFHDLALREIAEFERAERDADQAVDRKAQVLENFLDLAVFSFPQAQGEPSVRALLAVKLGFDAEIVDPVYGDPASEPIERRLVDAPVCAHTIAAQPAGRRQLQHAREPAVIGQQQQSLGVDVESADCDKARQVRRQHRKNRLSPLRIAGRSDEPSGLMEQKEAGALGRSEGPPVDADVVRFAHVEGWALQHFAIDGDTPLGNPSLGVSAGTNARPRHDLGDALAGTDL
jgi:hypothetical protein